MTYASPRRRRSASASSIACSTSAGCPSHASTTPTIRSGSALRYDRVGFPGKRLSVRFGSSSNGPVGSTR